MSNDLMFRSATELAALVRSGEVTSRELVEASYGTIGRLNDELNVFVTLCEDRALAEADAVQSGDDRPLAGAELMLARPVADSHAHPSGPRGEERCLLQRAVPPVDVHLDPAACTKSPLQVKRTEYGTWRS